MKTIRLRHSGYLLLTAVILLISLSGYSQESKLTKQEKRALEKTYNDANFHILDSLLNTRRFILVADFLQNEYGGRISVVQSLNFVKVNSTGGVLQTGSNSGNGSNTVGGATAEGSLSSFEIEKDIKNLVFNIRFGLNTQIGHYDVFMTVNAGNYATATITGTLPGSLTWEGHLETFENTRVFKGVNSI
jgi:hypothetical protein